MIPAHITVERAASVLLRRLRVPAAGLPDLRGERPAERLGDDAPQLPLQPASPVRALQLEVDPRSRHLLLIAGGLALAFGFTALTPSAKALISMLTASSLCGSTSIAIRGIQVA